VTTTARGYALRFALLVALVLFGSQLVLLSDPYRTRPDDFISSWAAGRLIASGKNPYDPDLVLAVQRTANWTKEFPYRIWYPPWTMPILLAFGILPYQLGRFLWYALSLGACLVSVELLWRDYRGPPRWRRVSWPLIFTFWPAVIAVRTGQISPLVLLGVVGFLFLVDRERWVAAGACLPLAAIKPQLLHLFWIAILLWVWREQRWRVLAGALSCALAGIALAMSADPAIVPQFLHMAIYEAPQAPASTLGTALRLAVARATGHEYFWLQFVPPALSLAWFLPYWRRYRSDWRWQERVPALIAVSLATTAYGWIYDQIVLLVPVVQVATTMGRTSRAHRLTTVSTYVLINIAILTMNVLEADPFRYIWVPFAFALWWAAATSRGEDMP
jgi:hypothetical protein